MALPKLETPTYELTLPSTGKKIKYRPFLVREHKILLSITELDNDEISRVVKDVVDVCTFNQLNVHSLPHFDIEYIFLHLRAKSISEKVDLLINCECENQIEVSFNIEDVKIEKNNDHTNKIMLTDEYGVEMNYPKFDDVIDLYSSITPDLVIDLVINNIKGIFNKDGYWDTNDYDKSDVEVFVNSLTKEQFEKIEEFFLTAPKIVHTVEADCPKCGKHNVSRIQGLSNFFV